MLHLPEWDVAMMHWNVVNSSFDCGISVLGIPSEIRSCTKSVFLPEESSSVILTWIKSEVVEYSSSAISANAESSVDENKIIDAFPEVLDNRCRRESTV